MNIFGLKVAGFGIAEKEITDKGMVIGQDLIIEGIIQKGIGKKRHEVIIGQMAEDRNKN